MEYTTDPFELPCYWVIASDDLSRFLAVATEEDPTPRIAFFESEGDARAMSTSDATPEDIRGCVICVPSDECLELLSDLQARGFGSAIALRDGSVRVLVDLGAMRTVGDA